MHPALRSKQATFACASEFDPHWDGVARVRNYLGSAHLGRPSELIAPGIKRLGLDKSILASETQSLEHICLLTTAPFASIPIPQLPDDVVRRRVSWQQRNLPSLGSASKHVQHVRLSDPRQASPSGPREIPDRGHPGTYATWSYRSRTEPARGVMPLTAPGSLHQHQTSMEAAWGPGALRGVGDRPMPRSGTQVGALGFPHP